MVRTSPVSRAGLARPSRTTKRRPSSSAHSASQRQRALIVGAAPPRTTGAPCTQRPTLHPADAGAAQRARELAAGRLCKHSGRSV
eukprot:scaffold7225_cov379-Prasinococcus_capsulatus_cf.AAC.8